MRDWPREQSRGFFVVGQETATFAHERSGGATVLSGKAGFSAEIRSVQRAVLGDCCPVAGGSAGRRETRDEAPLAGMSSPAPMTHKGMPLAAAYPRELPPFCPYWGKHPSTEHLPDELHTRPGRELPHGSVPYVEVDVLDVARHNVCRLPPAGPHDLWQAKPIDRQLLCGPHSQRVTRHLLYSDSIDPNAIA